MTPEESTSIKVGVPVVLGHWGGRMGEKQGMKNVIVFGGIVGSQREALARWAVCGTSVGWLLRAADAPFVLAAIRSRGRSLRFC